MSYASRDWKAQETTDLVGSKHTLTVTGQVETRRGGEKPKLSEASPTGLNPTILILDLKVEVHGEVGTLPVGWTDVEYSRDVSEGEFRQVTIRGDTDEQTIDVERILS